MLGVEDIFSLKGNDSAFEKAVWEAYTYQMEHNELYRSFVQTLNQEVKSPLDIPFLPISFFKTHDVVTHQSSVAKTFLSSATGGGERSKHHIHRLEFYEKSFLSTFEDRFGQTENWTLLALLPSYLEQGDSSLIYMVDHLIKKARPESSFWLNKPDELPKKIESILNRGEKVMLFGVSYALLDLADLGPFQFESLHIMETGGMKGRKKEMIRTELHDALQEGFGTKKIHSEYGMTELLSQAYSIDGSYFSCPDWMKVFIRETDDPFSYAKEGSVGGVNVIDLANWYSCPFIATDDLGRMHEDGSFEILGRFDHSDVRGCNLLVL